MTELTDAATSPLAGALVAARLPAQDLERARRFYADKLGLQPAEQRPTGLLYRTAGGVFALHPSTGQPPGTFTQMGWEVEDLDATLAELRRRGVEFQPFDLAGTRTVYGVAEVEGHHVSGGVRVERTAWFRDSEGNLLAVWQPVR
ncbi:MAG: hypothetical protein QOE86_1140 [Solirubrobacteraceae bacterium]|nr:hypothetical protein [Solirubrobacteraceae bacterium]